MCKLQVFKLSLFLLTHCVLCSSVRSFVSLSVNDLKVFLSQKTNKKYSWHFTNIICVYYLYYNHFILVFAEITLQLHAPLIFM